jgi:uncharacterized protein YdeI (YjbR/CyaY-like superfamily)
MISNKTLENYIKGHPEYSKESEVLRKLLLDIRIVETIKCGSPCFVDHTKNIAGIGAFKSHFGLWLFQEDFLGDALKKFIKSQEDARKAMRQWRFKSLTEIIDSEKLIEEYAHESVLFFRKNKEIGLNFKKPLIITELLQDLYDKKPRIQKIFKALAFKKKRDFVEHVNVAERMETKLSRLEKVKKHLLAGIGLNDKYSSS